MLRAIYLVISVVVMVIFLGGCKPTKNTYLNRKYQNLVARDNPYFNAREKLKESVTTLNASHIDDHTRVLDVFAYAGEKESKPLLPQMDEVYKKSSNVIQKRPLSKWIDDSYMLIGRSHFFKRDYFAALEAFQYVNSKYKDKNRVISFEAEIWIVKCYLYMDKLGEAEAVVSLLLGEKDFPKELVSFLNATAAAVYIRQSKYISALPRMKIAVQNAKGRQQKIRYNYILAQLYENAGQNGLAIYHYRQVIKRTPAYEFEFNAKLNIARLYNPNSKNASKQVHRDFRRMLNDNKNTDYFDQIYFELGNIELREKNIPAAIKDYRLSLDKNTKNQKQKALSYHALAKLYFAQPDYQLAQAYYDSLCTIMPTDYPDYKKIMSTKAVLSELIKHLTTIRTQDSLQAMAKLSPEELEKKINQMLDQEKQRKQQEEKNKKNQKNQQTNVPAPQNTPVASAGGIGSWYFYNPTSVSQGKTDFNRKWGERKLEDNWRYSAKEKSLDFDDTQGDTDTAQVKDKVEDKAAAKEDPMAKVPADKKKYYENLPVSPKDLKESNKKVLEAMYGLGVLYEEELSDSREAVKAYQNLLKRFPKSEYEPEVLYRLFKISEEDKNKDEAEKYKKLLIDNYPRSQYALIVQGKGGERDNNTDPELEKYYQQTYQYYQQRQCEEVIKRVDAADRQFPGSVLKPKFDLLKGFCIGRSVAQDSFKVVLEGIAESYPGTEVAARAKEVIAAMKEMADRHRQDSLRALTPKDTSAAQKAKSYDFTGKDEKHFYAVVLPIGGAHIGDLKARVADYNSEFHQLEGLQISALLIDDKNQIFVVKEFSNDQKAMGYLNEFESTNKIFQTMGITEYQHFIISSANFVKLLRGRNLTEYLEVYKQKFK